MLTNFQQLNAVYGDPANSDHYAYDDATANARRHRKVGLPELAVNPAAVADMGTIFTKDNGFGRTELYFRYDNAALPAGGGSLVPNLLPVKSYGVFVANAAGAAVLPNTFNVASVNCALGAPNIYTVTFSQSMVNNNYAVIASSSFAGTAVISFGNLTPNTFQLFINAIPPALISFAVLQYVV